MQRLNKEDINTPDHFDDWLLRLNDEFGTSDMERMELLVKHFNGGVYVDVGVFDSPMPRILSERFPGSEIWALDFAPRVIEVFQPLCPNVKYKLIETCYNLPFKDGSVDYVVAGEILEHLEVPQDFIKECLRVLKPGGWLALSTPHEEINKAAKIGGPMHLWSYDKQDLQNFGFTDVMALREQNCLTWVAWQQK
jgi:ubiquinone/menaquinone biosynthesis C-methylase UbiE